MVTGIRSPQPPSFRPEEDRGAAPDGRPLAGPALLAICAIHLACTPLFYGAGLDAIVFDGIFDAVLTGGATEAERASTFWYVATGLVLVPFGFLVWWVERHVGRLPAALGWLLLGFVALTVLLMPASGFWLFLVPAAVVLVRARGSAPAARRRVHE
ncbi:MAG TPA: DUF6463 family protein [Kofleriaceae bacterium]|nr:DUF6463 family protein [Kofleriaceae bacterium]